MASPAAALSPNQGLLHDLLHLLSQPLTSVHCALELSLSEDNERHAEEVTAALEQTDRVIEAVRLMREYLEAEEGHFVGQPFPLGLAIENALEQSSVLAEARGLRLFACGASTAAVPVRGTWLQRALFYLIALLVESEPESGAIAVVLEDGVSQSLISGHSLPTSSSSDQHSDQSFKFTREAHTLRQVKLEIARRVFESSGASLEFYSGSKAGFIIRLPRFHSRLSQAPA
jgi:hypothetical protein